MADPFAAAKRAAGRAAADLVEPGMRLGFGTGSTFVHVLDRLAERIADDGLEIAGGIPTSIATADHARRLGIPLLDFTATDRLDLAIDGADEVDGARRLVKGGGGALLREKIVAAAADRLVVIVSANKVVDRLCSTFRLPVEVLDFGWQATARRLADLGATPELRRAADGAPAATDNGNRVLDCAFAPLGDPERLAAAIEAIPGVLAHGLFLGMADTVLVGGEDGSVREL